MGATRFIVAGRFIDGSGAAVRRQVFLAFKDGIISAIGAAADLPRDSGAVIDDFSHCTILPALVDCSVSLSRSPSVDRRIQVSAQEAGPAEKTTMLEQHIRYCHAHGVLGVADSGDLSDLLARKLLIIIKTSEPLWRSSQAKASAGSSRDDFLKVGYSGNIDDKAAPNPRFCREDLFSILQRRGKKKVVVVANGPQQVAEALDAGCDAIEQGYGMGKENLRKMADRDVLWIPGILRAKNAQDAAGSGGSVCCRFSLRYVAPGRSAPGDKAFWKKMLVDQLGQLRLAREMGVTTALGTGAGSMGILHGESIAEEMKLFLKAGYSLEEAVRCGSENGTRFFDMEQLGSLTVGRLATFLIVRGTVKQLPRKLSFLEGIYVNGIPSPEYCKI